MARRKKRTNIINFFIILVIIIGCFLIFNKYFNGGKINETNNTNNDSFYKINKNNNEEKTIDKENPKTIESTGPEKNEETETKKEVDNNITINMELIGEEEVTINEGEEYIDQGVKATDNEGNNMSDKVEITTNLDINKKGSYSVIYSYGKNVIIRKVIVK